MPEPTPSDASARTETENAAPAAPPAWTPSPSPAPPPVFTPLPQPIPAPQPLAAPPAKGGWGERSVSRGLVLVLAPVLAIVMFAGGVFVARTDALGAPVAASPAASAAAGPDAELALVEEAWRSIQDNYVDAKNLDNRALAYAAIRGLVEAVGDEGHTSFMTAEQAKASDQSLSGTFVGIGVQVEEDEDGKIQITTVFPATPAEEGGLRRGDHILAVDGKSTEGETVGEVVSRVRGPEGEKVTLTLGRDGSDDLDLTFTRRKYDLPLVSWSMVPGRDVALIRLDQFSTGAADAVKKAISAAKEQGAKSIVFDLRGNPGGYVHEAIGVASQFLEDGIVYQALDRGGKQKDGEVTKGGLATDLPLVVLADGSSASSAEIVTGAIQDAKRGKVVGDKTFGTGTVINRFDLADGSSLRIGTERWLTRAGRPIWHEGLEPDVKVQLADTVQYLLPNDLRDMSAADLAKSEDLQLLKALELLR